MNIFTMEPMVPEEVVRGLEDGALTLIAEATLNHLSGARSGIVGVYQRHKNLD